MRSQRLYKVLSPVMVLLIQLSSFATANLYSNNLDVITELTDKSFPLPNDAVHIVKFFAPWCGHCKNMVPEYVKLATALKGQGVKVAILDATKYEATAAKYGIQGFPDIKIFAGSDKPITYNGERTAQAMANAVMKELHSFVQSKLGGNSRSKQSQDSQENPSSDGAKRVVVELDDSTFDEVVLESSEMWMVEFYAPWCGHCKNLAPHWEEAAESLEGSGIRFAAVDSTVNEGLSSRFSIRGFPTIKMFAPGNEKSDQTAIDYDGGRTADDLISWSQAKFEEFGGQIDIEVPELVSQQVFDANCREKKRCAVAVLPDIRDSGKEGRENYIELLKQAQIKARHVPFLWVPQNNQAEFEELYRLQFGFPALVYLRTGGDKEVGFVYHGKFDSAAIVAFLSTGKNMHQAIGEKWPSVVETEAWDGEEAPPLEEEDDDFDLDEFLQDEA